MGGGSGALQPNYGGGVSVVFYIAYPEYDKYLNFPILFMTLYTIYFFHSS